MFLLSLIHVLFFAPPLLYVGLKRSQIPPWAFNALLFTGIFIAVFHLYRLLQSGSYINAIHLCIIAPVLMAIGYKAQQTPRSLYEILLMITFAMIGWHTLNMVRLLDLHSEMPTHV